ncbi:MAG: PspC domain-containing protein [Actinomycetota bacterium]
MKDSPARQRRGRERPKEPKAGWVRRPFQITEQPLSKLRFARNADDALISGVAGGLGARWGVEPVLVRIAFVVLSFAGAVGVVVYLGAWWISLDPGDPRAPRPRDSTVPQAIAFGAIVLGLVVLLRDVGLWLGDELGIPLLIAAGGAAVVYVGTGQKRRPRWTRASLARETPGRPSLVHLLSGGALVVGGVVWFLTTNNSFPGILTVVMAVAVTTMGLAVVFGPWVYRMANQLGDERRDRIRSEERSDLAAHLHDSVLQTLALIQRNASSPRKMASLARRQERELRSWLYGQPEASDTRLEATLHQMADGIEESYEVTVETVVVGDRDLDERTSAVVHAAREAAANAARHSGSEEISVYVECEPHLLTAYIRDRGKGFNPEQVPNGRRGITDSIRGRVERHGGTVMFTTGSGDGTEVQIVMPV